MRRARYFGHAKTLFQLLLAATVASLTLVATGLGLMGGRHHQDLHLTPTREIPSSTLVLVSALLTPFLMCFALQSDEFLPLPARPRPGFRQHP